MVALLFRSGQIPRRTTHSDAHEGLAASAVAGAAPMRSLSLLGGIVRTAALRVGASSPRASRADGRTWRDDYSDMTAAEWALLH